MEEKEEQQPVRDQFLHVRFKNLYGYTSEEFYDYFDFEVDDQLFLVRRKEMDDGWRGLGYMVAIILPPRQSTTNNSKVLTKNDWNLEDSLHMMWTYLYLCSLVSGKYAEPGWYGYYEQAQELYGELWRQPMPTISSFDFLRFLGFSKKLFKKYYRTIHKFSFLKVALESYYTSGALQYSTSSQFINACTSLETLYNEDKFDIKYKLRNRLAFLLSFDGFSPIDTFDNAGKIYDQRSSIVHGTEDNKPAHGYLELTQSYARRSCMCFLIMCHNRFDQLPKKDAKRRLLKEIDEAMLFSERTKALQDEILTGIREYDDHSYILLHVWDESRSHTDILGMNLSYETSGSRDSRTDWFPEPVTMIFDNHRKKEMTVSFFTAEEGVPADQIEYTLNGGANWSRFDVGGSPTSTAARYQKYTIVIDREKEKRFNIQRADDKSITLRFNIHRRNGDPVTLTFCRIYRPDETTTIQ